MVHLQLRRRFANLHLNDRDPDRMRGAVGDSLVWHCLELDFYEPRKHTERAAKARSVEALSGNVEPGICKS